MIVDAYANGYDFPYGGGYACLKDALKYLVPVCRKHLKCTDAKLQEDCNGLVSLDYELARKFIFVQIVARKEHATRLLAPVNQLYGRAYETVRTTLSPVSAIKKK